MEVISEKKPLKIAPLADDSGCNKWVLFCNVKG